MEDLFLLIPWSRDIFSCQMPLGLGLTQGTWHRRVAPPRGCAGPRPQPSPQIPRHPDLCSASRIDPETLTPEPPLHLLLHEQGKECLWWTFEVLGPASTHFLFLPLTALLLAFGEAPPPCPGCRPGGAASRGVLSSPSLWPIVQTLSWDQEP